MTDDTIVTIALVELDGIANAPMTAAQRLTRAQPVLTAADITVADLTQALSRDSLPWNANKAAECNVSPEQWRHAVDLTKVCDSSDLGSLLIAMHRAQSAAEMLRAGYRAIHVDGTITWTR